MIFPHVQNRQFTLQKVQAVVVGSQTKKEAGKLSSFGVLFNA